MKTLDRELARAKVSANRVAVVVANEWKDGNDKVMPVKQWLEERRLLQVSNEGLTSSSLTPLFLDAYLETPQRICSLFAFLDCTKPWHLLLTCGGLSFYREKCSNSVINLL